MFDLPCEFDLQCEDDDDDDDDYYYYYYYNGDDVVDDDVDNTCKEYSLRTCM